MADRSEQDWPSGWPGGRSRSGPPGRDEVPGAPPDDPWPYVRLRGWSDTDTDSGEYKFPRATDSESAIGAGAVTQLAHRTAAEEYAYQTELARLGMRAPVVSHLRDGDWVLVHNFQPQIDDENLHDWERRSAGRTAGADAEGMREATDNGRLFPRNLRAPKTGPKGQRREMTGDEAQSWWEGLKPPKELLQRGAHCPECKLGRDAHPNGLACWTKGQKNRPVFQGNEKLGPTIHHTDLPAGATCGGESAFCDGCYAKSGMFRMPSVKKSYASNLKFLLQDPEGYGNQLSAEVKALPPGHAFRPHSSGDIMDETHARILQKVADENPDRKIYLYTRSWRPTVSEGLRGEVDKLAMKPNVTLQHSTDPGIRHEFKALGPLPNGEARNEFHAGPNEARGVSEFKDYIKTNDINIQCPDSRGLCCDEHPDRHPKPETIADSGVPAHGPDHPFRAAKPNCSECMLCHSAKPGVSIAIPAHGTPEKAADPQAENRRRFREMNPIPLTVKNTSFAHVGAALGLPPTDGPTDALAILGLKEAGLRDDPDHTHDRALSKGELAEHIRQPHAAGDKVIRSVMPASDLRRWSTDELQGEHRRMHQGAKLSKEARHRYTESEKRALIDEAGEASNLDRLNLDGTHYADQDDEDLGPAWAL